MVPGPQYFFQGDRLDSTYTVLLTACCDQQHAIALSLNTRFFFTRRPERATDDSFKRPSAVREETSQLTCSVAELPFRAMRNQ